VERIRRRLLIIAVMGCLIFTQKAWGESICTITVTNVNFSGYDVFSPFPLNANGDIGVTFNQSSKHPYTVKLDAGQNSGGSFNPRKMLLSGGGATLNYYLYLDAACTQIWGDGTGSTYTATGEQNRITQHHTVYGEIPAGQNVSVGTYGDTITITVEW